MIRTHDVPKNHANTLYLVLITTVCSPVVVVVVYEVSSIVVVL